MVGWRRSGCPGGCLDCLAAASLAVVQPLQQVRLAVVRALLQRLAQRSLACRSRVEGTLSDLEALRCCSAVLRAGLVLLQLLQPGLGSF